MKKYFILAVLCLCHSLISIEVSYPESHPYPDWDGEIYQKGNSPQEHIAIMLLKEIALYEKHILDVGCGSGNITSYMAETASFVRGIDKSESMINRALQTYDMPDKLKFEVLSAEDMVFSESFDLITFFFCVNWFKDKPKAFKNFFCALKSNGIIFGTIRIQESIVPNQILEALARILPELEMQFPQVQHLDIASLTWYAIPSKDDIISMLEKIGFEDISIEPKLWNEIFKTREDLASYITPIIMSTPVAGLIPKENHEFFLKRLIDNVVDHLNMTDQGYLLYPMSPAHVYASKKHRLIVEN
jgi:ubiquinone/menaquinone biosynthesis C-methylase UbiE